MSKHDEKVNVFYDQNIMEKMSKSKTMYTTFQDNIISLFKEKSGSNVTVHLLAYWNLLD